MIKQLNPFKPNYHKLLLIGNTSSGKTTLVREQMLKKLSRKLIVDTNMELGEQLGVKTCYYLRDWDFNTPCYVPNEYTIKHLDEIIRYARRNSNLFWYCDDLDIFTGGQYYLGVELPKLLSNGRHQNIGLAIANKVPSTLDPRLAAACSHIALFAQNAKHKDTLREWNGSLNFPHNFDKLILQPPYHYAWFEPYYAGVDAVDPKRFVGFFKTVKPGSKNPS